MQKSVPFTIMVSICCTGECSASAGNGTGSALSRVESALQQNEILDVFFDDWAALTIDDGSYGSKADNHLKVWSDCLQLDSFI